MYAMIALQWFMLCPIGCFDERVLEPVAMGL